MAAGRSGRIVDGTERDLEDPMRTRTLIAGPVVAVALVASSAGAAARPVPSPDPTPHQVDLVPVGPEAILDLPDDRTESDVFAYRLVLDDSTSDARFPIVEQRLVITEPDGDRAVRTWAGAPGAHAETSVMFDEPGTWTFSLTVTTLFGRTDATTATVEVHHDLSEPPPWDHGHPTV